MEKSITGRPQRNRRHSRRAWPPEDELQQPRPVKRLFTPEIKRMLKDWLIRRRDNPYPSRDEKKRLAIETGLTYTQICNWFANWRRKLKNSERERAKKSWGHLIKHYNTNARGNVEQFSISSEDSIWEEHDIEKDEELDSELKPSEDESHEDFASCSTDVADKSGTYLDVIFRPNYYVESASSENEKLLGHEMGPRQSDTATYGLSVKTEGNENAYVCREKTYVTVNTPKYKQKMMEKYLRDTNVEQEEQRLTDNTSIASAGSGSACVVGGAELSKWLESAAKFTPDKNNYYIEWNGRSNKLDRKQRTRRSERMAIIMPISERQLQQQRQQHIPTQLELEAAEALANLAFNCRQRMLDANGVVSIQAPINAITS